jgi:hypothetical protein
MALQVVHKEGEQGFPGAFGVTYHINPIGLCSLLHGFVFRHDDIWRSFEEAGVLRERRVVVGYGNAGEDKVDGQESSFAILCVSISGHELYKG